MLARRQRRRLLDADHVIFQPQVSIDILLRLKVPRNNSRSIRKCEHPAIRGELMFQVPKQPSPKVFKIFHVGFANLPQQQTFQPRNTEAIVRPHLCE